eukprot:7570762-Pyramimonas_sp.AAC.1
MEAPPHLGTPLTRFAAPQGAPPKVPVPQLAWRRRPILAHPAHVSWPRRELLRRSQWRSSHGGTAPFCHLFHGSWPHRELLL